MGNNNSTDIDAIKRLDAQKNAAWEAGDVAGFMDLFTDGVVWMPPGEEDIVGKEACQAMVQNRVGSFKQIASTSEEIVVDGDLGFHRFIATLVPATEEGGESGQFTMRVFHVLRKQADGSWKIARYIWN